MRKILSSLITLLCMAVVLPCSAHARKSHKTHKIVHHRSVFHTVHLSEAAKPIDTALYDADNVSADTLLQFAQNLIGTPYRPATSDPSVGFDCSGFVSYVFKSFNFSVPRSSCEFVDVGEKIRLEDARPGDVILFTGTKKHTRKIGHMGIVYCNDGNEFRFIHSTSGKEYGVTITAMDDTYRRRFVQVIRLLKHNDEVLASQ